MNKVRFIKYAIWPRIPPRGWPLALGRWCGGEARDDGSGKGAVAQGCSSATADVEAACNEAGSVGLGRSSRGDAEEAAALMGGCTAAASMAAAKGRSKLSLLGQSPRRRGGAHCKNLTRAWQQPRRRQRLRKVRKNRHGRNAGRRQRLDWRPARERSGANGTPRRPEPQQGKQQRQQGK